MEGVTLTRKFIKRSVLFVDSQPFCVPVFTTLGGLKGQQRDILTPKGKELGNVEKNLNMLF